MPASSALLPPPPAATAAPLDSISLDYAKGVFIDTGKMLASPLHWDSADWLKVGMVVGVTGGLTLMDRRVEKFAQTHQNGIANKFAFLGNGLGNPLVTLPPLGAFYLYGRLNDDKKAVKTSLLAVESLAISGMFTEAIKLVAQRDRPSVGASHDIWNGPHLSFKNLSFSSGHTASSFAIATVIAEQYKDTWFVPPIAYGFAALTGASRVYSNQHWGSDVFFGAALGYFVGQAVVKYHKEERPSNLTLVPVVDRNFKGLSVSYKF